MKSSMIPAVFLLSVTLADSANATSLQPNPLSVRQLGNAPAACLPDGKLTSIELKRAYVLENSPRGGEPERRWVIELIPGAKPLTLHPGECVSFGHSVDGYRETGALKLLETGKTYVFGLKRGDQLNKWVSSSYVGIFCVQRASDGSLAYLPYVDHPDGTTTYPPCGRYIGSPPAPDGINPPRP